MGIGAVLSQEDNNGQEQVIAYGSRLLSKPEWQYCVTRWELLALVVFIRHFQSFLLGGMFILQTDHGSLTWLKNFKELEGQMARWLERLQEFNFTMYIGGERNIQMLIHCPDSLADSVVKNHGREVIVANTSLSETINFPQEQLNDSTIGPVLRAKING